MVSRLRHYLLIEGQFMPVLIFPLKGVDKADKKKRKPRKITIISPDF